MCLSDGLTLDEIIDDKPPDVKAGWFIKKWMYQKRALKQASARHVCNGGCLVIPGLNLTLLSPITLRYFLGVNNPSNS